jgi:hypothetical protein
MEEVAVHAGRFSSILVEDYNNVLIGGDAQGILVQQLRPRLMHLINLIIIVLVSY